jgi:hypothetical protein
MSIYESSITNPKKQLEFYKDLSEQLQKEIEKLNHYKLLYQKVKDRNEKAIEYLHETCNIGLGELSVYGDDINPCELKKILEGNNETD